MNFALNDFHTPVLLKEAIDYLAVVPKGKYLDATLGGGGHTAAIVKSGGQVLGIDLDEEAVAFAGSRVAAELKTQNSKLQIVQGNFRDLRKIAVENGFNRVEGVLFDLGVSAHQLESAERGFSFHKESRLDMRLDPLHQTVTAADLINGLSEKELDVLFNKYGQEALASPIARAVVRRRRVGPIETTLQLAELAKTVYRRCGVKKSRIHPATRIFQALRIAVNDELGSLEKALPQAVNLLKLGGRLVVISFHSLEDRVVKNFFKDRHELRVLTPKPIRPTRSEVKRNPRARSAKLRAAERIA